MISLKCLCTSFVTFFRLEVRQFVKLQKLENMMKKQSILKKSFHPFKRHLQQNWKAEDMPVVAGHLVKFNISKLLMSGKK